MDKYFQNKMDMNEQVARESLHVVGLVSIYISSKFEDVYPIHII